MKKPKFNLQFFRTRFQWKPTYRKVELLWKDKYDTPRCERSPYFQFEWLWFSIYGQWGDDQYWEQWLWINKYKETKETWPWVDSDTNQNTWIDYWNKEHKLCSIHPGVFLDNGLCIKCIIENSK